MAKPNDVVICEQCQQLYPLRDVVVRLVKPKTKLRNVVICKACEQQNLESEKADA